MAKKSPLVAHILKNLKKYLAFKALYFRHLKCNWAFEVSYFAFRAPFDSFNGKNALFILESAIL